MGKIVEVEGFAPGDTFKVDGPMWYDGEAKLLEFNDKILTLELTMKATDSFGKVDFVIKDGLVDLIIKLEKPDDDYRLTVEDNNNNGKTLVQDNLKVEHGMTEDGLFTDPKKFIKASNEIDSTVFTIDKPGHINIKTTAMPVSVDLIKK